MFPTTARPQIKRGRARRLSLRALAITAMLVAGVAITASAASAAPVTSISVTVGHLQAQGTEVPIQVNAQCEGSGWDLFVVDASLTQVSGHKLARGFGSFFPSDAVSCPGSVSGSLTVIADGAFAFKQGNAMATFDVVLENPTTGVFYDQPFAGTTRLTTN